MNKLMVLSSVVAALVVASAAGADSFRGPADVESHRPQTYNEKPIVNRPHSPETVWEEMKQTGG